MDMLRACYKTCFKFYRNPDGTANDRETAVEWYFCRPGAKPFPEVHRFTSSNYRTFPGDDLEGPGEIVDHPRTFSLGVAPPGSFGQSFCGTLEEFLRGVALPYKQLDVNADMVPICAGGLPPVVPPPGEVVVICCSKPWPGRVYARVTRRELYPFGPINPVSPGVGDLLLMEWVEANQRYEGNWQSPACLGGPDGGKWGQMWFQPNVGTPPQVIHAAALVVCLGTISVPENISCNASSGGADVSGSAISSSCSAKPFGKFLFVHGIPACMAVNADIEIFADDVCV